MPEETYSKDISVAERQVYILSLLSENPQGFTADEIVEKLNSWDVAVKKRTITRDIDELSLSYGISEEERNGKTYYKADKYHLGNVDLTISDLMSVAFMQSLLKKYQGVDMADHAGQFLSKLVGQTGFVNKVQLMDFQNMIQNLDASSTGKQDVDSDIEKIVRNAMESKKKLQIEYYAWNSDSYSTRVIHPYQLVINDGYFSVMAYCETRKALRQFRLSRIQKADMLSEGFVVDKALLNENKTFIHLTGKAEENLVLHFDAETARYVEEYEKSKADHIEKQKDGSLIFRRKVSISDEVTKYVLGFGSHVKVLEPAWFAEDIAEEIQRMVESYQI